MKFHLRVYDNFHYADESEAYDHRHFETYAEALIAAKAIVDEFIETNWKPGIKANELLGQYATYGEDPIILPNEPGEDKRFSAHTYAKRSVEKFYNNLDNK